MTLTCISNGDVREAGEVACPLVLQTVHSRSIALAVKESKLNLARLAYSSLSCPFAGILLSKKTASPRVQKAADSLVGTRSPRSLSVWTPLIEHYRSTRRPSIYIKI